MGTMSRMPLYVKSPGNIGAAKRVIARLLLWFPLFAQSVLSLETVEDAGGAGSVLTNIRTSLC